VPYTVSMILLMYFKLLRSLSSFLLIIGAAVEFQNGIHFFETSFGSVPSMSYILSMKFGAVNSRSISDLVHAGVSLSRHFCLYRVLLILV